ncbi:FG-GAP repeat protein [Acidovorax sp. sic0104]|uniref:FG-GAP repeat protein n=1 Tax=Acidovorax sp. sic0104 TaxID=2854784 RepID=UPI001C48FE06|nr:FG-GAP repeat protein [Acidovorax sp. sic0104]MBV7542269.1 FG-GAP repeat protein [Acidovorax sp. sic0104]
MAPSRPYRSALLLALPLALAACGGGSGSPEASGPPAPAGFEASPGTRTKGYLFTWNASASATRYELFEDPDGASGPLPEAQIAQTPSTSYAVDLQNKLLHERVNATYRVRACDASGCGPFTAALTPDIAQAIGYFKASNSGKGDAFGSAVALSSNGLTMAVGAPGERSNATCIAAVTTDSGCDFANDSIVNAGAVYVFSRATRAPVWVQTGYLKASNNRAYDVQGYLDNGPRFGTSLALSADGTVLVVGAPGETSSARGVNGNSANTQTQGAGAVYVFKSFQSPFNRIWRQEAYIKASNTLAQAVYNTDIMGRYVRAPQAFGTSVALSADGALLAVGAPGDRSNATGVNGDQQDSSLELAGAVYTYARSIPSTDSGDTPEATWTHRAYLKASNTRGPFGLRFGASVALAGDGLTLAVGAPFENGGSPGVNGNQDDTSANYAGAVYMFTQRSGEWSQQAYVKASNPGSGDAFGGKVALSANGDTLAVGAQEETASGTGVNKPQGERTLARAGAAYLFTRSAGAWSQQAYLKSSNTGMGQWYGSSLALSADGNTLAVGAMGEASSARGINGKQADNTADGAGAAYVYQRSGDTWTQRSYLKASNTDAGDLFGASVALSGDGTTLAVGATSEDSTASTVQGDQADNSGAPVLPTLGPTPSVGAVYMY